MHLRDLVARYGIRLKKELGQNLLLDDNINRIMVEAAALTSEDDVVEVGAGLGALTRRLCDQAGRVLAVEIDMSFMPCLEEQFGARANVRLFRGDILNHDLEKLLDEFLPGGTSYKMVSNLPYYITTPILFHFFESPVRFTRLVVMLQEEVALRLGAAPGSADYGVLTLAAQQYAKVDIVHKVPRTCFSPRPKVDSCIVRFRTRETPLFPAVDALFLSRVVRTAFAQRRKTLRNSVAHPGNFGLPRDALLQAMKEAGVDPAQRPQRLALDDFARLARAIKTRVPEERTAP
jgi:16S rRNA (adenine1518-N6/adenine1519-N6)-dimethyltransferase